MKWFIRILAICSLSLALMACSNKNTSEETKSEQIVDTEIIEQSDMDIIPQADWNGTFKKEGETVTLAAVDSTSFEFYFENTGIGGVARVEGSENSAAFQGDDNNVILFEISGSVLEISIQNMEGETDVSSVLNGVYELSY